MRLYDDYASPTTPGKAEASPDGTEAAKQLSKHYRLALFILGPALFLISLLAKESSIWLPLWFGFYDLVRRRFRKDDRKIQTSVTVALHLPFILIFAGYFWYRMVFLPPPPDGPYAVSWFGKHLFIHLEKYIHDVANGVLVPPLAMYITFLRTRAEKYFIYTSLMAAILVLIAAQVIRKREFPFRAVFCLAWFGLGLIPLLPLKDEKRHFDYYISMASFGVFWAAGYALDFLLRKISRINRWAVPAVLPCLVALILLNSALNRYMVIRKDHWIMDAAKMTQRIHEDIKRLHPDFPQNAKIIILLEWGGVVGDEDLLGIKAVYMRPDLQVFINEAATQVIKKNKVITFLSRKDFDYSNSFVFIYTTEEGLSEFKVGPEGIRLSIIILPADE